MHEERMREPLPALVLNADYQPLSYFPLSLWDWRQAIRAVFLGRVVVVAEYDWLVRSARMAMRLPSIIALKTYVRPPQRPAFTRFNLFLRDGFSCQYCGAQEDLTFDHVIPRSRGGRTTWENVVAACAPCNRRKANRLPAEAGMFPRQPPRAPRHHELQAMGRRFPPDFLHESWLDYLYWDTRLEP